jgi:hypothetical protein
VARKMDPRHVAVGGGTRPEGTAKVWAKGTLRNRYATHVYPPPTGVPSGVVARLVHGGTFSYKSCSWVGSARARW